LPLQDKKAEEITILELEKNSGAFTDYFVVCSERIPSDPGIADEVELRLNGTASIPRTSKATPSEWVLLDYVDFVVTCSRKKPPLLPLERLWKSAKRLEPAT